MAGDWHPRRVVFPSLEDDENEPMTHSHGTSPVYVPIIWMVDFYEVNVGKYTYVRPMDPSWDMGLNWKVSGFRGSKRVRLKVWKVSTPTHLFGFAMCCFTWRRDLFWSLKDLFITKNSTLDLKELAALNGCQSKTQEFIFLIPRDPITSWEWKWNPNNMVRCLNIPIIIWEYDWMPRVYHAWNGVFTRLMTYWMTTQRSMAVSSSGSGLVEAWDSFFLFSWVTTAYFLRRYAAKISQKFMNNKESKWSHVRKTKKT